MKLDIQTSILIICVVYFVLHGAIWMVLRGQKNLQVDIWAGSGVLSGFSVVLSANHGLVSEFLFYYVAPFLMVVGNLGRLFALRMYLDAPQKKYHYFNLVCATVYMAWSAYLHEAGYPLTVVMLLYFSYWVIGCLDYGVVGYQIYKKHRYTGGLLIAIAGFVFCSTLGQRAFAIYAGWGSPDVYGATWDQGVMIVGQILAITLSNMGFLQVFLAIKEESNLKVQSDLSKSEARSNYLAEYGQKLQVLIDEREEMIRQLILSNKSAGMGALAASFAHELNQPLGAIRLNAQLMEHQFEQMQMDPLRAKEIIDSVIKDNKRASEIIRKLRNMFANPEGVDFAPFDLSQLVIDTLDLVRVKTKQVNINMELDIDEKIQVRGDATQLQQVVLNLLNNALDALVDSGKSMKNMKISLKSGGNFAQLKVEDNAEGMSGDIKDSIFQLFKTSKAAGMGVGLWLSQTVVRGHGGLISFESTKGIGTTFLVELPQ